MKNNIFLLTAFLTTVTAQVYCETSTQPAAKHTAITTKDIRVIDLQKIFAESHEGREIEAEAIKRQQAAAAELQKMQQDLMRKGEQFKERVSKGLEKEESIARKQRELQSDQRKLELRAQEVEQEMREYQAELQGKRLEPFRRRLSENVKKFGDNNNTKLILSLTGEVVYASPELHITDDVVKQLNADHSAKAKAPSATIPSVTPVKK